MVSPLNTPALIPSKIAKNKARAVQSLNKLSPSKIRANLLGAPTSLNKDKTATGSVAEIIAPKSKQISNGTSNPISFNP
jgi:hypothetical protein